MSDNFFKVPIHKLTDKLVIDRQEGIQLNASQLGMIEGMENNRFWVHISSRRTGKSLGAAILAFAKLLEPGSKVMVVAPNFTLSSIIWDYVTNIIANLQIECKKFNQKDKVVQLINGSEFRLLSANNRTSLVGRAAHLLIIDEAAVIPDDEYFQRDLRPALSTYPDSRALFISTPRGKGNYLYEYYMRGQDTEIVDWGSAKYPWTTNPLLRKADIEEAQRSMSKKLFAQEYLCDWSSSEAMIYNLDEEKHIIDLGIKEGDPRYTFFAGFDVGYRDDTAFVVIGTDGEKFYVVDEFYVNETPTSQLAEMIKEKIALWDIETIYIDSAAQQLKADFAYEYDIYCENAIKSVNDGILAIGSLIDNERLYFDEDKAQHSFKSVANYKWKASIETQKPIHDEFSHGSDAIRYGIYTYMRQTISVYGSYHAA